MEYYNILPKEARLELLINADYPTILELCQDPLFKELCESKLLWERKLKQDFNIISDTPKDTYVARYRMLIRNQMRDKRSDKEDLEDASNRAVYPLNKERDQKLRELREEMKRVEDNYRARIDKEKEDYLRKHGYYDFKKEIETLSDILDQTEQDNENSILKIRNPDGINFLDKFGDFGAVSTSSKRGITHVIFPDYRDAQEAKRLFKDKYEFID